MVISRRCSGYTALILSQVFRADKVDASGHYRCEFDSLWHDFGIGVRNVVENKVNFTNSRNVIIAALILVLAMV